MLHHADAVYIHHSGSGVLLLQLMTKLFLVALLMFHLIKLEACYTDDAILPVGNYHLLIQYLYVWFVGWQDSTQERRESSLPGGLWRTLQTDHMLSNHLPQIGRASCRERV